MKVILQQDIKKLGNKGDIIDVAEGYGRNYLLPRGLAIEATSGNVKQVSAEKQAEKNKKNRATQEAQELADRINNQKLQIATRVGEAGKLFGSITAQDISDRLKKQYKVEIDKRKIDLKEPIKSLGKYTVTIRVHPKVRAEIVVDVIKE